MKSRDNIVIAHEVQHFMRHKHGRNGWMAKKWSP